MLYPKIKLLWPKYHTRTTLHFLSKCFKLRHWICTLWPWFYKMIMFNSRLQWAIFTTVDFYPFMLFGLTYYCNHSFLVHIINYTIFPYLAYMYSDLLPWHRHWYNIKILQSQKFSIFFLASTYNTWQLCTSNFSIQRYNWIQRKVSRSVCFKSLNLKVLLQALAWRPFSLEKEIKREIFFIPRQSV